jgi:hypothetical protein
MPRRPAQAVAAVVAVAPAAQAAMVPALVLARAVGAVRQ